MNQAKASRTPKNRMAPTGASRPQMVMPLAVMKLPMLHCTTKGKNSNSVSWLRRKKSKLPHLM
jgi:hypothetical protein